MEHALDKGKTHKTAALRKEGRREGKRDGWAFGLPYLVLPVVIDFLHKCSKILLVASFLSLLPYFFLFTSQGGLALAYKYISPLAIPTL